MEYKRETQAPAQEQAQAANPIPAAAAPALAAASTGTNPATIAPAAPAPSTPAPQYRKPLPDTNESLQRAAVPQHPVLLARIEVYRDSDGKHFINLVNKDGNFPQASAETPDEAREAVQNFLNIELGE